MVRFFSVDATVRILYCNKATKSSDYPSSSSTALGTADTAWRLVLEMLDSRSLSRMACVSRRFYRLAADPSLWREISFSGGDVSSLEAGICLRGSAYTRAVKLKLPWFDMYTLTTVEVLAKHCSNLTEFGFEATWPLLGSAVTLIGIPPSVTTLSMSQVIVHRDEELDLLKQLHTLVVDNVHFARGFGDYEYKYALTHLRYVTVRCRDPCYSGAYGVCIVASICRWQYWNLRWVSVNLSSTCLIDAGLEWIIRHAASMRRLYVDDCRWLRGRGLTTADVSHLDVFSAENTLYAHMNKNSRGN